MITLIDRRAYEVSGTIYLCNDVVNLTKLRGQLSLAAIQAEWILTAEDVSPLICDDVSPSSSLPTPPASPKMISKSQRKSANRRRRKEETDTEACCGSPQHELASSLMSRLRNYLLVPHFLPVSIKPSIYHQFVSSIFRFVILRLPKLLPLATDTGLGSIEEFLDVLES